MNGQKATNQKVQLAKEIWATYCLYLIPQIGTSGKYVESFTDEHVIAFTSSTLTPLQTEGPAANGFSSGMKAVTKHDMGSLSGLNRPWSKSLARDESVKGQRSRNDRKIDTPAISTLFRSSRC